jgi:putative methyltransferase (TIGR04325 family)
LKEWIRNWAAPGLIRFVQRGLDHIRPAPWEFIPEGWSSDARTRGWNVAGIAEMRKAKWSVYVEALKGTGPIGIIHGALSKPNSGDLDAHNTLISCAYVFALSAWQKQRLSLLDWGGGIGDYYLLGKAVLPAVEIEYYCQDVPLLCQAGRDVLPQAHFLDKPDACFSRQYDLVLASSSVWYEEDWRALLDKLAAAANSYLYVTRMIFVKGVGSYVAIQRPAAIGYPTEYLCWILNRQEFLDHVLSRGMEVVREFFIGEASYIHRAPEQGDYRGFLFRKRNASP